MVGRITDLRTRRSETLRHTATTAAGQAGAEAGRPRGEKPVAEPPIEWPHINARRRTAQILQTVKLRAFNPRATDWRRMHDLAAAVPIEHGHLDPTDETRHPERMCRLARQRHPNAQSPLDAASRLGVGPARHDPVEERPRLERLRPREAFRSQHGTYGRAAGRFVPGPVAGPYVPDHRGRRHRRMRRRPRIGDRYRLITTLLDHRTGPAPRLVGLYHERWEIEVSFLALKDTLFAWRVLRSADPAGLEQELWALLTVYQTLRRITVEAVESSEGVIATRPPLIAAPGSRGGTAR
ncbi:transposase [Kitasatospora sp. NPDC085879]|uniref:transposase n=1 Tax=Kitasatospora sp. NPDC085879 TaxID=3154769 RepID=UPI0034448DD7